MSILDTKKVKTMYLLSSVLVLLFSLIYEFFSHNVYSIFMVFAFLIPLMIGYLPVKIYNFDNKTLTLNILTTITLTIGSIIKGVLDIYGTTNSLIIIYLILGIILLLSTIISYILKKIN